MIGARRCSVALAGVAISASAPGGNNNAAIYKPQSVGAGLDDPTTDTAADPLRSMRHVLATTALIEIAMVDFAPIDLDENLVRLKIFYIEFHGIRMSG